jgi:hypothetical protein
MGRGEKLSYAHNSTPSCQFDYIFYISMAFCAFVILDSQNWTLMGSRAASSIAK